MKLLFNRNKTLFLITSYFPQSNTKKWPNRWDLIMNEMRIKCDQNSLQNILIACDFNKNLLEDNSFTKELSKLNLNILENNTDQPINLENTLLTLTFI